MPRLPTFSIRLLGAIAGWLCLTLPCVNLNAAERTFYVDSEAGDDAFDGQSPQRAWRTLERVNTAELRPGDTVRFRFGGQWRGSLIPVSGEEGKPVTYTSYGEGPKPRILGSASRSRPEDWRQEGENLWATLPLEYARGEQLLDLRGSPWTHHQENGARVERSVVSEDGASFVRFQAASSGTAANHLQVWGPKVEVEKGRHLLLTFRARSSKTFRFPGAQVLLSQPPWTRLASAGPLAEPISADWKTYEVVLSGERTGTGGRLHLNLGGVLPAESEFDFQPLSLHAATANQADPLDVDVGNIIFDEGAVCGWKKWSREELKKPYEYYYDAATRRVFLYLEDNPATRHRSIELALSRHVVNQGGKHHVVYDGLAIFYGAAHGFGGGNTHHLVIRNCDVGYIGGGHQHTRPDGQPVRYGNGIEFWNAAHDHLVEGCRIWQVYDAALTNQGRGADSRQVNITYRNNLIHHCEYSFEYWNNPETAVTENIRFLNNTCLYAGGGWGRQQRPDPNGSHLMFYTNTAATKNVEIKYNIFYDYTDWGSRYSSGWKVLPDLNYNLWYSERGIAARWFNDKIADFEQYQTTTGLDADSRFANPLFLDAARGDYRLGPQSPARMLRPDGGPVGAESLGRVASP